MGCRHSGAVPVFAEYRSSLLLRMTLNEKTQGVWECHRYINSVKNNRGHLHNTITPVQYGCIHMYELTRDLSSGQNIQDLLGVGRLFESQ